MPEPLFTLEPFLREYGIYYLLICLLGGYSGCNPPAEGKRAFSTPNGGLYHPMWAVRLYGNSQRKSSPKFLFFCEVFSVDGRYIKYWQG
jgi:hypothetical protein